MAKKKYKTLAIAFIVGVLISSVTTAAYATTVASNYGTYSVNGISYRNQASIDYYSSSSMQARTLVETSPTKTVLAGYMGALASLYDDDGELVDSSSWVYNNSAGSGFSMGASNWTGRGAYYSYGATRGYNGNGYDTYYTFRSPSVNQ